MFWTTFTNKEVTWDHFTARLTGSTSNDSVFQAMTKQVLKGTVQRKLRGVESYINQKDFVSLWTADILF